jgi:hypothetical protein
MGLLFTRPVAVIARGLFSLSDLASFGYLRIMRGSWMDPYLPYHLFVCQAREGALADKSLQLIVDGLSRAAAEPGGMPLHGSSKRPGLFANTAAARLAAGRCKDEGYLRVIERENNGKMTPELCAITEKGLAYLLDHASPKQILEEINQVLRGYQAQVTQLVATAQKWQNGIGELAATIEQVLEQALRPSPGSGPALSANGSETWLAAVFALLVEWRSSPRSSDCPLPELYRRAAPVWPGLTIGHFHDGLRRLHDQQKIYLHPWTGPLYELPEPAFALLIGHEIAYYASTR